MAEESTAPDLVELTRQGIAAVNRRDLDAAMRLYADDVVWESLDGLGVFDGATAVRGFLEDWLGSYVVFDTEPEEIVDMGGGITFVVVRQSGRLLGATGRVEQHFAWAITWEHSLAVSGVAGMDIDSVRATAERLANDRAQAMSENVEIVRRSNALTNDGDLDAAFRLAHPDVEWVIAREHPNARTLVGEGAVREYQREWQETLPDVRVRLDRLLDAGGDVVAIGTVRGAGVASEADVEVPIGLVFVFREGLITRVEEYLDPAEALKAAGLAA
jgi:ketosteroid isomerase-like protein